MDDKIVGFYRLNYFENDKPVPYKLKCNKICFINPIKVKDYNLYNMSKNVMTIDKNSLNDFEIIQMSYLEFVVKRLFSDLEDGEFYKDNFINFFGLVLNKEKIGVEIIDNRYCLIAENKKEDRIIITPKEVEEISKISFYQNDPTYKDRYLSPDVKKEIESYIRLKYGNQHSPTLEERKAFVTSKTGILMKNINEMTYRNFTLVYDACKDSEIYIGRKIIQGSYKYKVDEDIPHPLFEEDKDIVDIVFSTNAEQFENKISQING